MNGKKNLYHGEKKFGPKFGSYHIFEVGIVWQKFQLYFSLHFLFFFCLFILAAHAPFWSKAFMVFHGIYMRIICMHIFYIQPWWINNNVWNSIANVTYTYMCLCCFILSMHFCVFYDFFFALHLHFACNLSAGEKATGFFFLYWLDCFFWDDNGIIDNWCNDFIILHFHISIIGSSISKIGALNNQIVLQTTGCPF